jgi:hypothetical protein
MGRKVDDGEVRTTAQTAPSNPRSPTHNEDSTMNISGVSYGLSQDLALNQSIQQAINSAPNFSANPSLYGGGSGGNLTFGTTPMPSNIFSSNVAPGGGLFANQFSGLLTPSFAAPKAPSAPSTSSSSLGGLVPVTSQSAASPFAGSLFKDFKTISGSFTPSAPANDYPAKGFSIFARGSSYGNHQRSGYASAESSV